jgi:hypothetical protein
MMPVPQWQQWQGHQGDICNDANAVKVTMPKRRQGDVHNETSAAMMPAPQRQQWQWCQGNVRDEDSAMPASTPVGCWQ